MKDEMPSPYPVWPKMGFEQWRKLAMSGPCRFCEDDEHKDCLDGTEEKEECSCATMGHVPV